MHAESGQSFDTCLARGVGLEPELAGVGDDGGVDDPSVGGEPLETNRPESQGDSH